MNKLFYSTSILLIFLYPNLYGQGFWVNKTSAPATRYESGFVKSDTKLYLLGGDGGKKATYIYNTATGTWSSGATSPIGIHHFQAVELNGTIYIIGAFYKGYTDTSEGFTGEKPVKEIYTYKPSTNTWTKGSLIPRPRGSAGAVVYNGKIYIVCGQTQGHTGGHQKWFDEYNPTTNTWKQMPDAPRARDHFQAAVIGSRLYVVGGRRTNRYSTEGVYGNLVPEVDVFDFSLNKWLTNPSLPANEFLTIPNIPTKRGGASTFAFGNEIIIVGGESLSTVNTPHAHKETEALNINTFTWKSLTAMNQARHGTQAIVYGDRVYTAGGASQNGGNSATGTMEAFFREENFTQWTELNKALSKRYEAVNVLYNNKIYVFGGYAPNYVINNVNEVYDPEKNTWILLAPIPDINGQSSAINHNGVVLVDDEVWLVGGRINSVSGEISEKVWIYNIPTNTWRQGPSLPAKRASGGLAKLGRKLYFFAGGTHSPGQVSQFCVMSNTHFILDLDNQQAGWQDVLSPLPSGFERVHAATAVLKGKFYFIGGQVGHDCGNTDQKWVHVYDPSENKWTRIADLPTANSHAEPGTFALDGKIISVGGEQSPSEIKQYDPQNNTWTKIDDLKNDFGGALKLLAPVAKVIGDKIIVSGGGLNGQSSQPNDQTFIKNFSRNPSNQMGFLPAAMNISLNNTDNQSQSKSAWLWTVSGKATYSVNLSNLPSWLSISKDPGNTTDESATEFTISCNSIGLAAGTYTYQLKATASGYTNAILNITLEVENNNLPPIVNAGNDQTLILPEDSTLLIATASDPDGTITQLLWTQQSGPALANLAGIDKDSLKISALLEGVYVFRLTATDNLGANTYDEVSIQIILSNQNPLVNAGADINLTLPANNATLTSTASDPDGFITQYLWTQESGQTQATLSGVSTATLNISNLSEGIYNFRITVTDNLGASAYDEVQVIVNPASAGQAVSSFTLINATNDQDIRNLSNNDVINLSEYESQGITAFNIRANTNPSLVGSVVFTLSGTQSRSQTETVAPYALYGDNPTGNYSNWTPKVGTYTLIAKPYTAASGTGTAGTALSINFSVIKPAASKTFELSEDLAADEEENRRIKIYPNPFKNRIHIEYLAQKEDNQLHYFIYTNAGKLLDTKKYTLNSKAKMQMTLDLNDYTSGFYYLIIQTNTFANTIKLFKE